MENVPPWRGAARFQRRRALVRGALVRVLLTLALGVAGLLLLPPAASAAAATAQGQREGAAPPVRPRPTRTPPPSPTATIALSPTATPTLAPSATATSTAGAGIRAGGQTGTEAAGAQTTAPPLGAGLWWGLGVLLLTLLGFGGFLVLLTRRTARVPQPAGFDPHAQHPTRARLNQLHQVLPARPVAPPRAAGRTAEPLPEEDHPWKPLSPPQRPLVWAPLSPPRWLIEAGLLKEASGTRRTADPLELPGLVPADQETRDEGER